jgi:hypothetical protein
MAKVKERVWTTKNGETRTAWIADYRDQQGVRRRGCVARSSQARNKAGHAYGSQRKQDRRRGLGPVA